MTRENKLALIIGFGLILVVGILVSDHFSAASRQNQATLNEPEVVLAQDRAHDHELLTPTYEQLNSADAERLLLPGPLAGNPTTADLGGGDDGGSGSRAVDRAGNAGAIQMPGPEDLNREVNERRAREASAPPSSYKWHTIKHRETLAAIARREYGDERLWRPLAEFNRDRVPNPDVVPTGVTIRLPKKEVLLGTNHAASENPAIGDGATPRDQAGAGDLRTHVVQSGETLSKIAKRYLGSASRWREIVECNTGVITNPDSVSAGTPIRIPSR